VWDRLPNLYRTAGRRLGGGGFKQPSIAGDAVKFNQVI